MNEQQRQSYLRNMGYQVYFPRSVLPGARPSPCYELPDKELPGKESSGKALPGKTPAVASPVSRTPVHSPAPPSPPPTAGENVSATSAARKSPGPADTHETAAGVETAAPAVTATADELRFSLQYFAINEQLAVINEEPHQLRGKQSREVMALLNAILRALKLTPAEVRLPGETLHWPLADGLQQDESERAAKLALLGFFNQCQAQDGFNNLLIFTAQLPQVIVGEGHDAGPGDVSINNLQCNLTLTHSLHTMLVHPLLKRDVWAHLQALRVRLQR